MYVFGKEVKNDAGETLATYPDHISALDALCAKTTTIKDLIEQKLPLPKGTLMLKTNGKTEALTDNQLCSANRVPNHLSETEPFWIHGWADLHCRLRVNP